MALSDDLRDRVVRSVVDGGAERTVAGFLAALADIFNPAECENDFRSCGHVADGEFNST